MNIYTDRSGNSSVAKYEIGEDSITVEFSDGKVYLYDYQKPGLSHTEHMKRLAIAGEGLNSFINREVRNNYASRVK